MATRPGEELVATLFADVHYYYGVPTAKPPHHRFDKGSYLYLFENASQRRARIEIANNAGTPDQDAFTGHLDSAHVKYSYKNTNLLTLTVEGGSSGRSTPPADTKEWHLPTFDPRNENKYMYKLHTVDVYFWTKEDALQFVNGVRRVLPPQQITILDEPVAPPPHPEEMHPVVQQLENIAITDPYYQDGRTRDSRGTSATVARLSNMNFAGPPISATPQSQEASNFAPMAYNPAAPAAPEVIAHREKTPPPPDGALNPLVAAAASDHGQTYGIPFQNPGGFSPPPSHTPQQQQRNSYFPGQPAASAQPSQFSQPPPSAGLQSPYGGNFQNTFALPPVSAAPPPPGPPPPQTAPPAYTQAISSAPSQSHAPVTQYANYPGSPGLPSGLGTPGIYSPGLSSPGFSSPGQYNPSAHQPQPPPGGFASYNYNPQLSHTKPLMNDYSIHQQAYRPSEGEAAMKMGKQPKPPRGKLEERAGQLEKGMGSLFKKLEKKIG